MNVSLLLLFHVVMLGVFYASTCEIHQIYVTRNFVATRKLSHLKKQQNFRLKANCMYDFVLHKSKTLNSRNASKCLKTNLHSPTGTVCVFVSSSLWFWCCIWGFVMSYKSFFFSSFAYFLHRHKFFAR